MRIVPLSEAKAKLSELLDSVLRRDEEIMITRNGRPAAVLVSPDDFESWKETVAIRSDAEMMREIEAGLAALDDKSGLYSLAELFD